MKYVSTRGLSPPIGFAGALIAGLAPDGGLYVPGAWPRLTAADIAGLAGRPYPEVAAELVQAFIGGDIAERDVRAMCEAAYSTFSHRAVAPLVQLGPGDWLLELFHGPTFAFKDVAMQLLARLMDHVLAREGAHATIVGATSGDTGGAAIEAFRGRTNIDVVILFPDGRVSAVQQRQMTTSGEDNVHPVAIAGSFDDCQAIVKQLFADAPFRERVRLCGVNSINWARIMAQTVYYFTAAVALGAPKRRVSFTVPTGNFGDIFAGYAAKRMGLPVERLVIATNLNDILARTLESGDYALRQVSATRSPSMDIQVSSNFERLLFEVLDRKGQAVAALMRALGENRQFSVAAAALRRIRRDFDAGRADEAETTRTIAAVFEETGLVVDPHTAVALTVGRRRPPSANPMVTLATAHPAKFPDAVREALGREPEAPERLASIMRREERYERLPADAAAVKNYVLARCRVPMEA